MTLKLWFPLMETTIPHYFQFNKFYVFIKVWAPTFKSWSLWHTNEPLCFPCIANYFQKYFFDFRIFSTVLVRSPFSRRNIIGPDLESFVYAKENTKDLDSASEGIHQSLSQESTPTASQRYDLLNDWIPSF